MADRQIRPRESEIFSREFEVVVNSIEGDEGTYYIKGDVHLQGEVLPFTGVAFGRAGGHNIGIEFGDDELRKLQSMGLGGEVANLIVAVQVRLVQGEMEMKESKRSNS